MSRNWMVAGAVAAVVAIVLGVRLGRDLLSDDDSPASTTGPRIVRFHETVADVSLSYPATWTRRTSAEDEVPLIAAAPDGSAGVLVRRSVSGLDPITRKTLPVARKLTDPLIDAIKGAKLLDPPEPVELGGLFGWRYRYTYGRGASAAPHDHYFLFKRGLLIALVFQATPASRLKALAPQFDRVAQSFGNGPPA